VGESARSRGAHHEDERWTDAPAIISLTHQVNQATMRGAGQQMAMDLVRLTARAVRPVTAVYYDAAGENDAHP